MNRRWRAGALGKALSIPVVFGLLLVVPVAGSDVLAEPVASEYPGGSADSDQGRARNGQPFAQGAMAVSSDPVTAVWPISEQREGGGYVETGRLLGTENGVAVVTGNGTIQQVLTGSDGLPSGHVTALEGRADYSGPGGTGQHTVWVGTDAGLGRLDVVCVVVGTGDQNGPICLEFAVSVFSVAFSQPVSALTVRGQDVFVATPVALYRVPHGGTPTQHSFGPVTDVALSPDGATLWVARQAEYEGDLAGVEEWRLQDGVFQRWTMYAQPNVGLCLENATALDVDASGHLRVAYFDYEGECSEFDFLGSRGAVGMGDPSRNPRNPRMARFDGATWISPNSPPLRPAPRGGGDSIYSDIATWGSAVWLSARADNDGQGGVAYSIDDGQTWSFLGVGDGPLPSADVLALQSGPDGIHIATAAGAVRFSPLIASSPANVAPVNGVEHVSLLPRFRWQVALGAATYELQVSLDAGFSDVVASISAPAVGIGHVELDAELEAGRWYHWRVRGVRGSQKGQWSAATSFRVGGREWRWLTPVRTDVLHVERQDGVAWLSVGTGGLGSINWLSAYGADGSLMETYMGTGWGTPRPVAVHEGAPGRVWVTWGRWQEDFFSWIDDSYLTWINREHGLHASPGFFSVEGVSASQNHGWVVSGEYQLENNYCTMGCWLYRVEMNDATGSVASVAVLDQNFYLWNWADYYFDPPPHIVNYTAPLAAGPDEIWVVHRVWGQPDQVLRGQAPYEGESDWTTYGPSTGLPVGTVRDLVRSADGTVWAPTSGGLGRYTPGSGWSRLIEGQDVELLALGAGHVWAATSSGLWHGVPPYAAADWTSYPSGVDGAPTGITALAVDTDGRPWVGTLTSGLAHHDGEGWAWFSTMSGNLPSDDVNSVAVHSTGGVWVGTELGAVSTTVAALPYVRAEAVASPQPLRMGTPYPNPSRNSVTVSFELASPGPVDLSVYDILGRRVAVLVDGDLPSGSHEARWAAEVASGVYVVRLTGAGGHLSRQVTIVR